MNPISSVHICGAGGIGTSGLALLFHEAGCHVTATDLRESEITAQLRASGIDFDTVPRKDWVANAQRVVTPATFPEDHEEIRTAKALHIPVMTRTEALLSFCKDCNIPALICVGTLSRAKTASIVASMSAEDGFCLGLSLPGQTHARLGKRLIMDLDERELMSCAEQLQEFPAVHLVLSDWADESMGYYAQDFNRSTFERRCLPFVARYTRILNDEDGQLCVVTAGASSNAQSLPLHIACSESGVDLSLADCHVVLPPCTQSDAQAFAVACAALGLSPDRVSNTTPVGWFESIDARRTFDIRMHPVSVQASIQAMRARYPKEALTVVIKPFQTTLDAYDANVWRKAFSGASQVIVMTPGYNVSDKGCRNLATALKMRGLASTAHPKKQILAEYKPEGPHQLWIGAPDMFKP